MQNKQELMYTIKKLRKRLGKTQAELANEFKTTEAVISNIENGKMSETVEKRVKSVLLHDCAEFLAEELTKKTASFEEVVGVAPVLSKCGNFFSYEFHTTFGVALIKHTAIDDKFFVSHKPIEVKKELLVSETKKAQEIVKLLNQ